MLNHRSYLPRQPSRRNSLKSPPAPYTWRSYPLVQPHSPTCLFAELYGIIHWPPPKPFTGNTTASKSKGALHIDLWLSSRLNRSSTLPSFPVGAGMFIRSLWLSFLIGVMWQISNIAFDVYFTQKPLSADGKTISEKSPDPNGTLISGLKASSAPLTQVCSCITRLINAC